MPNYFVFRVTFRFETPWFLPDISYTAEFVSGTLEPADRGVSTSPLLESSAQSLSGSKPNRTRRIDGLPPGTKTAVTSVNALAGATGAWQGQAVPIALDATIEINFSIMVADGLGIDSINPDLGDQISGDADLQLTTRYKLTGLSMRRRPLGGGPWETIENITSAASPRAFRWSWDHDTRVNGQTAPKKLLLNGRTPFTVGIDNPTADAEILTDNPNYPCCQIRRPDVARFDFGAEPMGPIPAGFVRDFRFQDRGTVAPIRIRGSACVVTGPTASGASDRASGCVCPHPWRRRTVSSQEDLAVAVVRVAVVGKRKTRLIVIAIDRLGQEVDRKQLSTGSSAFVDVELDPGRDFTTVVVIAEDLQSAQARELRGAGCDRARGDRAGFGRVHHLSRSAALRGRKRSLLPREHRRPRCGGHVPGAPRVRDHAHHGRRSPPLGDRVGDHDHRRKGRFHYGWSPWTQRSREPGLELEPYVVSHAPGGRGITYREESVHLVLSDALKIFGPGAGATESDFRLPITIVVESAFDANPTAHQGKSSRASADWFIAHRGEADPWVTTAELAIALALTRDGRARRYQSLTEASSGTCPPDDVWVERQPRVGVEPFDPSGRALWEPLASYVAVMRLDGSPVVDRSPFEAADIASFTSVSGTWTVTDGVLTAGAAAMGAFGDADWDLYRVDVRGVLGATGEFGVVVLADAASPSSGVRALLRRTGAGGTLVVETATGVGIESVHVAEIGDDSSVTVEVFADAIRCRCGDSVISVPRAERGPGSCQLVATDAGVTSLRVHGVDMYRRPFRTSRYEGFSEHIATYCGDRTARRGSRGGGAGNGSESAGWGDLLCDDPQRPR